MTWKPLTDAQWVNIVNHDHAWSDYSKDDAVHEAVKPTESKCWENNRATLTAEREASDKLATALQRIAKLRIVEVDEIIDDYVDVIAEVAAIRATHTNGEQA